MLYKDGVGSITIAIYAFVIIFSTLYVTSAGILQGLGRVMVPAKNLFIGIIIKIILNIVLVYYYGINGAVIATVCAYIVASSLNILAIKKNIDIKLGFSNFFLKPITAAIMMGVLVYISKILSLYIFEPYIISDRILMLIVTMISITVGLISFTVSLFITGTLSKQDMLYIPRYGSKLVKIAEKLRILKD